MILTEAEEEPQNRWNRFSGTETGTVRFSERTSAKTEIRTVSEYCSACVPVLVFQLSEQQNRTRTTSPTVLGTPPHRTRTKTSPLEKSFEAVTLIVGFSSGNPPTIGTFTAGSRIGNRTRTPPEKYREEKSVHYHHRKKIFWRTFLASKRNFPDRWKNKSTTEFFSLWPPFSRQRKVLHWSRAVYAFFFLPEIPFLDRNRRNRKPEPFEPSHAGTLAEPWRPCKKDKQIPTSQPSGPEKGSRMSDF